MNLTNWHARTVRYEDFLLSFRLLYPELTSCMVISAHLFVREAYHLVSGLCVLALWVPGWDVVGLDLIVLCHLVWILWQSCCTIRPFHPPPMVLVYVLPFSHSNSFKWFLDTIYYIPQGILYGFVSSLTYTDKKYLWNIKFE